MFVRVRPFSKDEKNKKADKLAFQIGNEDTQVIEEILVFDWLPTVLNIIAFKTYVNSYAGHTQQILERRGTNCLDSIYLMDKVNWYWWTPPPRLAAMEKLGRL